MSSGGFFAVRAFVHGGWSVFAGVGPIEYVQRGADPTRTSFGVARVEPRARVHCDRNSVIGVDFEPVPWLAQEIDIEGYVYLRVSDYQLVGLVSWLNRIPSWNRVLRDYAASARFRELVSGIPMVTDWVLTNTFRDGRRPYVQDGTVIGVTWKTP